MFCFRNLSHEKFILRNYVLLLSYVHMHVNS